MLAKLTSKNQLTLPRLALQTLGEVEYFDVEVRAGQIVLTPVRIQRGDAVRARLAELGLQPSDVEAAVGWARSAKRGKAVAESPADDVTARRRSASTARKRKERR